MSAIGHARLNIPSANAFPENSCNKDTPAISTILFNILLSASIGIASQERRVRQRSRWWASGGRKHNEWLLPARRSGWSWCAWWIRGIWITDHNSSRQHDRAHCFFFKKILGHRLRKCPHALGQKNTSDNSSNKKIPHTPPQLSASKKKNAPPQHHHQFFSHYQKY